MAYIGSAPSVVTSIADGTIVNADINASAAIATSKITGLATSATTDTTNASNISSGTLPAGRYTDTNTTYAVGDGGLTQINFTSTDNSKLDGIATGANNYSHPTGAGNNHIPSGGSTNQVLTYSSSGTATWATAAGGGATCLSGLCDATAHAQQLSIGCNSCGIGSYAVAVGITAKACGNYETVVGYASQTATGKGCSVIIGSKSETTGHSNTVVGTCNRAHNSGSPYFGAIAADIECGNTIVGHMASSSSPTFSSVHIGVKAGINAYNNQWNVWVGTCAGGANQWNSKSVAIGACSVLNTWKAGSIAIGFGAKASGDNTIAIGCCQVKTGNGQTCIGGSDVYLEGAAYSDRRAKCCIQPSTLGLDFVNELNAVSYKWINRVPEQETEADGITLIWKTIDTVQTKDNLESPIYENDENGESTSIQATTKDGTLIYEQLPILDADGNPSILRELVLDAEGNKIPEMSVPHKQKAKRTHYGLIAQDVKATLDNFGISTEDFAGYIDQEIGRDGWVPTVGERDHTKALRYEQFVSILIKAVQELNAKVDALGV